MSEKEDIEKGDVKKENTGNEALINLKDKIYTTRKCRINASERYKKYDTILSGLNIWYSIWLIMIAIISFNNDDENLKIITITTSVLVFGFSMLALSFDFKSKYYIFKNCYIQLNALICRLENLIDSNQGSGSEYDHISDEYNDILNHTDNHSEIDYKTYLVNEDWTPNSWAQKKYGDKYNITRIRELLYLHNIFFGLGFIILIAAPIIIPVLINLIKLWIRCV